LPNLSRGSIISSLPAVPASTGGTLYGEDLRNSVLKIDLIHRLPGLLLLRTATSEPHSADRRSLL
jgi:hypothetical protein